MKIFIDWGSTNFRAFLMDEDSVVDRRESPGHGVLKNFHDLPREARAAHYSAFLQSMIAPWLERKPESPVFMCGAIGSREGWIDTGYTEAPANLAKIAKGLLRLTPQQAGCLSGRSLYILPGLAMPGDAHARHDVMRSEDIKSLGALACAGRRDALLCIPGTHCKWVEVKDGAVKAFQTILTGELYALLSEAGSLSVLFGPEDKSDDGSFDAGFDLAAEGQDLLADLFPLRSRILRGAAPASPHSFLSGVLIGHEVRQACLSYKNTRNVILLSDPGQRQDYYTRALTRSGWTVEATVGSEQAVCKGLSLLPSAAV